MVHQPGVFTTTATYTHIANSSLHDAVAHLAETPVDRLDNRWRHR